MRGSIYLLRDSDEPLELVEQEYNSESLLQGLLSEHPSLLAGDQMNPDSPRQWLHINSEVPIPAGDVGSGAWSLDHLFLDQDGVLTLVEVKRGQNTDVRRKVVGQMLDYAANAVAHWSVEEIQGYLRERCRTENLDLDAVVEGFLSPERSASELWQAVKTNLQASRIRLLFVADTIPTPLRRIVEFLNEQTDPAEVLAVEVPQFAAGEVTALVPRIIGQTMEARDRRSASEDKRQWDELSFVTEYEKQYGSGEVQKVKRIISWAKENASRIYWGEGEHYGGFVPIYEPEDQKHQLFHVKIAGRLTIYFQFYNEAPFVQENMKLELLSRLNEIPPISLSEERITGKPSVWLSQLSEPELDDLLRCFEWYIEQVDATAMDD